MTRRPIHCALFGFALLMSEASRADAADAKRRPDSEFGGHGVLDHPAVVVEAPNGEVLVLDSGNHRIVRLDTNGRYVGSLGGKGGRGWPSERGGGPSPTEVPDPQPA